MKTAPTGPDRQNAGAERLRTACDLWEAGVDLQRQRFRLMYPGASADAISHFVSLWLQDRPGAQRGDGPQPTKK